MSKLAVTLLIATTGLLTAACYVESDSESRVRTSGAPVPAEPDPEQDPGGSTAPSPVLVEVDTDQTLNADPGRGVGVFVEYRQGGGWHVWWTCDTEKSKRSCAFTVEASLAGAGTIGAVEGQNLPPGAILTTDKVKVTTKTSSEVHGMTFQTPAGSVLTLSAKVDSVTDGSFIFFVQDGKVNGGYPGKLSNPLQFVGKTP